MGTERGHGTGEEGEGLIGVMDDFAWERNAESERYLSGEEDIVS